METTLWTHWAWFALFGAMWLLIAGNNIASLVDARRRGGTTSLTLFLGGFFGVVAVLVCPIQGAWIWFWVPALVDPGSLPTVFHILRTRQKERKSQENADKPQ